MAQETVFLPMWECTLEKLPPTIYDAGLGTMVALPVSNPEDGSIYNEAEKLCNAANLNTPDGPYQFL